MIEARNLLVGGLVSGEILTELKHLMPLSHALYWKHATDGTLLFLLARGNNVVYRENREHVLVGLGHVAYPQKEVVAAEALKEIERHYHAHTHFPIDRLEGSFALILLDKIKDIIVIYRNIVGFPAVYYSHTRNSTIFSDSISVLAQINIQVQHQGLKINHVQLPTHFIYGKVWDRETLFSDIFMIMPGEQILFKEKIFTRSQLQTFAHMTALRHHNCVQSLEKIIRTAIDEYAETYPKLGSFFSGGVDSSYLQVHLARQLNRDMETFSADLVHPSWEIEREYARSGSDFFKSRHMFIKVHPSTYPNLLIESTTALGHPLGDGQVALISILSKTAVENAPVCLCGMCADVLFGTGSCQQIDMARQFSKLIPWSPFRQQFSRIIGSIHFEVPIFPDSLRKMQKSLELDLKDEFSPSHPLNVPFHSVDLGLMLDIFGSTAVRKAMSLRRGLLNQYQVTGTLKEQLHALYLLKTVGICEQFYQLASSAGLNLIFPYLDSRVLKTVFSMKAEDRFPFLRVKKVIKDALLMYLPRKLVQRRKSGWGLPLFEWLSRDGVLSRLAEQANVYPFLKGRANMVKKNPSWSLWNLLTFDIWHKIFIDQTLAQSKP